MLLLDKEKPAIHSSRKVAVLSTSTEIQDKVSQRLRVQGMEYIEILNADLFTSNIALNAEDIVGIIIDIHNETDIVRIAEYINTIVPQNIWCCLIGNSDSITMAEKLLKRGILYFHTDTQLDLMMEKITASEMHTEHNRHTIKICVLGCKGGIGSSFISSHIANQIITHKKIPVLLAQGPNGSQDLDLLFDKKLQGDIVKYDDYLDLFNGKAEKLTSAQTEKYNFIIYDQPIFNINKDYFPNFFEYGNNFILVVDRHIGSLRVAKQFLDQCENSNQIIRTFVCISDHKAKNDQLMSKADIETLLNTKVDTVIPFIPHTVSKNVLWVKFKKIHKNAFFSLAMKIIGILPRNNTSTDNKGLFSSLLQKLLNK
ncbi:pilus assembly protein [Caviibacterium pharyngocola]|uniref:Pilus assembly protein n=1 Tax=Caviibacterium pharyngocola TaxID=28159 RepID=A0A2M8RWU3_9PAST|nr:pilus assembly protein [Caviibacterium pharyngocola]PJG83358.1 pilus assembly protein [Caviibacterium pharyngocola]